MVQFNFLVHVRVLLRENPSAYTVQFSDIDNFHLSQAMLLFRQVVSGRLGGRYFYAQDGLVASLTSLSGPENSSLTGRSSAQLPAQ